MNQILPLINPPKDKKSDFKMSIINLMRTCDSNPPTLYNLYNLSVQMKFHRRRFYDVMNVLNAVGVCQRVHSDSIYWCGLKNVIPQLQDLARKYHVFQMDRPLEDIIPFEISMSIEKITEYTMILFIALGSQNLNIRDICYYIARNNGKQKGTLSKLYQISRILNSAGILEKTKNPGEIHLKDQFFLCLQPHEEMKEGKMSISSLLSRPVFFGTKVLLTKRIREFHECASSASTCEYESSDCSNS